MNYSKYFIDGSQYALTCHILDNFHIDQILSGKIKTKSIEKSDRGFFYYQKGMSSSKS